MKRCTFIVFFSSIQFSLTSMIPRSRGKDTLIDAAVNIIDECFGSPETRSELLLAEVDSDQLLRRMNLELKISNLILSQRNVGMQTEMNPIGNETVNDHVSEYHFKMPGSKTSAHVIATDNEQKLQSTLDFLRLTLQGSWIPRSPFLIILPRIGCNEQLTSRIFKTLWEAWILNAILLCSTDGTKNSEHPDGLELHAFNPFSNDHPEPWKRVLHEIVEVPLYVGNFNHSWYVFKRAYKPLESPERCADVFFDKTQNLGGYTIPITMLSLAPISFERPNVSGLERWAGPDGMILNTLAKKLRFNAVETPVSEYSEPYGEYFENGTYTGSLSDVYDGRSYLGASFRYLLPFPNVDSMYPYIRGGVCFLTKNRGYYPRWTNVFASVPVWLTFCIFLVSFTVIFFIRNNYRDLPDAFLEAERLIVGVTLRHSPVKTEYRILMSFSFLIMIVVGKMFTGGLLSLVTIVRSYPNVDTDGQLKELNMTIYGFHVFKKAFIDPELRANYYYSQGSDCPDSLKAATHWIRRACIIECNAVPLYTLTSTVFQGSKAVKYEYAVFITTMNWPLKNRYDFDVQKLFESGLVTKWLDEAYWENEILSWSAQKTEQSSKFKPLTVDDLIAPLVVLLIGTLLSLLAFVKEILIQMYPDPTHALPRNA